MEGQKLQAVVSQQLNKDVVEQMEKCIQEKDEKSRTVKELLETRLIQVATREEELSVRRCLHRPLVLTLSVWKGLVRLCPQLGTSALS